MVVVRWRATAALLLPLLAGCVSTAEFRRLEHCALWQLNWVRGRAEEGICRTYFVDAVAGRHELGPAEAAAAHHAPRMVLASAIGMIPVAHTCPHHLQSPTGLDWGAAAPVKPGTVPAGDAKALAGGHSLA